MKKNNVVLGVNSFLGGPHHDNGAFLFIGDEYVGINSERIDREKYSSGYKWKTSSNGTRIIYEYDRCESCIEYCLGSFGITSEDIDVVVYLEGLPEYVKNRFPNAQIFGVYDHHFLHAMGVFKTSGFQESAVLVMDGQGKKIENNQDSMILQSIYHASEAGIKLLEETKWDKRRKIGIGTTYEMFTRLLGFTSEGTTMGLSSYASGEKVLKHTIYKKYEDKIYINDDYIKGVTGSRLKFLPKNILFEILNITEEDLENDKLPYGFSSSIAGQLQKETENAIIELALKAYKLTNCKYLCITGGVGLNSVANTKILENTPFEKVFIIPSCDDSGLALGAALYGKDILNMPTPCISNFYFGKLYNTSSMENSIEKYKKYFSNVIYSKNITQDTAKLLADEKIIGWFQGRSESGPRALGNRSILSSPFTLSNRDKVNEIKKREKWRPLAPSVLGEFSKDYFLFQDDPIEYKYMLKVVGVTQKAHEIVPAVVHIDNTARIQTVFKEDNELYYNLISDFHSITETPILLNTSFNSAGEPIVETPEDAIKMFLSSNLDALVLGSIILYKKQKYKQFEFNDSLMFDKRLYTHWKVEVKKYEDFLRSYDNFKKEDNHIIIQ